MKFASTKVSIAALWVLCARESLASSTTASSLSATIKNPLSLFTLPPLMTMPEPVAPILHYTDTVSGVPSSTAATTSSQQPSQQSSVVAVDASGATPTSALYPINRYEIPYVIGAGAGASTTFHISATVSADPNGLSFLLTTYSSGGAVYTSNLGIIVPSTASTATRASSQNAVQTSNANSQTSTFTSAVIATSVVMMTESTTKTVTLDSQHPTTVAVTVSQPSDGSTSAPSSYATPVAVPQPRCAMNVFKSKPFAERRDLLWKAARGDKVQARQEELWEPDKVENAEPVSSQQDTEADSQEKREAKGGFRAGGGSRGGGGCAGCSSADKRISTPRMSLLLALFIVMLATPMVLPGIGAAPVEAGHATTGSDPVSEARSVGTEVVDLAAHASDTVPVQKLECDPGASLLRFDGCGNAAPAIRRGPSTLAIALAVLACLVILPMAAAAPVELNLDADTRAVNATAPSTSTLVSDAALCFAAPTAYTPSQPATPILKLRAEAVEADDPGPTCVHDGHAIYSNYCPDSAAPASPIWALLSPATLSSPLFRLSWAITTLAMA